MAGIPASDFIGLARHHLPGGLLADALRAGVDWKVVQDLYRVISPLAMPPRVPWARRYLFAGTADRIVPIAQARRLWPHRTVVDLPYVLPTKLTEELERCRREGPPELSGQLEIAAVGRVGAQKDPAYFVEVADRVRRDAQLGEQVRMV